jgi:hypothetical protein
MQWARTESAVRFPTHSGSPRAFALAMTRLWSDGWYGMVVCASMITLTMSLRGKSGAKDAAIHCMQWARTESAVRSPTHSGSPRAFSPRDDKVWHGALCLSLRGKSGAKDAAIHCMQWSRTENALRFTVHSGSPRATPSR